MVEWNSQANIIMDLDVKKLHARFIRFSLLFVNTMLFSPNLFSCRQ